MKRCLHHLFLVHLFLAGALSNVQAGTVDSLQGLLATAKSHARNSELLHELYRETDSLSYAKQELVHALKTNNAQRIAQAHLDIGRSLYFAGKNDEALKSMIEATRLADKINDKKLLGSAYRYIGYIYRTNDPLKAKQYYQLSLDLALGLGDDMSASYAYSAIGNVYEGTSAGEQLSMKKALSFYLKSLAIREKKGTESEIAASLNETSRVFDALGMYEQGLKLKLQGLQLAEKSNDIENLAYLHGSLGIEYVNHFKEYHKALDHELKAYAFALRAPNNHELLYNICKATAKCYHELGDSKQAETFFLRSSQYMDSLIAKNKKYELTVSAVKQTLERQLEKEKLKLKDAEILKSRAEAENLALFRNSLIGGIVLMFLLGVVLYRAYKSKQKSSEALDKRNREIQETNEALIISENKFRQIAETINDVFYLYNVSEKKYEYISPNCAAIFGQPPEYFYSGRGTHMIIHPEDIPFVNEANIKLHRGIPYELEFRVLNGDQITWIAEKSYPIFDVRGVLVRNSGICRDITQRRKNEELLEKQRRDLQLANDALVFSEGNFKQITETIDDVFYLYDIVNKKYQYVSPNCQSMLGIDPQFLYEGGSMKVIVFPEDMPRVVEANVLVDAGEGYEIEYRVIVNGGVKWIAEKSSPIYNEEGRAVRNSGVCSDITSRKTAEEELQRKTKDITDSILYARTIQDAVLVPVEKIAETIPEIFILSRPKDIVSGDFYFFRETDRGFVMALADCTGHGVSAGFMSMIGNAFLNEIINDKANITAAEILEQLRNMIISSLHQDSINALSIAGMDITLMYFDKDRKRLQYAGAFNSLFQVRDGMMIEHKADLCPVGISYDKEKLPFTNNIIEVRKGDAFYAFSDGYIDQFGGPNDRKFMKRPLLEMLLSIQDKKMADQEKILTEAFDEWKGDTPQVDDVLILGFRI